MNDEECLTGCYNYLGVKTDAKHFEARCKKLEKKVAAGLSANKQWSVTYAKHTTELAEALLGWVDNYETQFGESDYSQEQRELANEYLT